MRLPHPHLIALRSAATLVISAVIGQAGWAAAGLGRDHHYFRWHALGALVTLLICLGSAVLYTALRRTAGPVLVGLAWGMAVLAVAQVALALAHLKDVHIFLGVLTAMLATALTSWTYRHPAPTEPAAAPAA